MRLSILMFFLAGGALPAVETMLPAPRPADRYEKALAQSPFALATVVEAPAAPQDSFAMNWVLTGLSRMPDDQGVAQDFVVIRSRDQRIGFSLFGAEESKDPDAKGVSIAKVDLASDPRKSVVTLKRGTELAKVEFGQETATPAPAAPGPGNNHPGAPGAPGRPNFPAPGFTAPQMPQGRPAMPRPATVQPPSGRGSWGGQGGSAGAGPGATAPQPGVPSGDHRRVRVIQSKP